MKNSMTSRSHTPVGMHMRNFPPPSLRPPVRLHISAATVAIVCFFAGIMAGTFWVGVMPDTLKEQLGVFGRAQFSAGQTSVDSALFFRVFFRRQAQAGFLWLIGMTAFAVPALLLAALGTGFSCAALVSLMTVQAGLLGLPVYLASVIPQAFLYLPAFAVLFFWGFEPIKKTHLAGFLVLSAVIALGAFAECFLNPLLLSAVSLIR